MCAPQNTRTVAGTFWNSEHQNSQAMLLKTDKI